MRSNPHLLPVGGRWGQYNNDNIGFILSTGQISSTRIGDVTPNNILLGGVVCPNLYPVEFTCVGVEVGLLGWRRNGINIGGTFTAGFSSEGNFQQVQGFTLFLDSITTRNSVANMTSRLVGNSSNLMSGDRITCVGTGSEDTAILNFSLRGKIISIL